MIASGGHAVNCLAPLLTLEADPISLQSQALTYYFYDVFLRFANIRGV